MKKNVFLFILICFGSLAAQENNVTIARDGFTGIATDARAAGQGDIGVATSTDAFSQFWNPSKYVFSDKKNEIGATQIIGSNNEEFNEFKQANLNFYDRFNNRSAFSLGFRGYSLGNNQVDFITSSELSIEASYALRLGETFAMSVGGRLIL